MHSSRVKGWGWPIYVLVCMHASKIQTLKNDEEIVLLLHIGMTLLHSRLLPEVSSVILQSHE